MSATAAKKTPSAKASGPSPAVMGTYARQDVVFERGEGSWMISTSGERYLDLASGIAVNAFGHAHPQADRGAGRAGRQAVAHVEPLSRGRAGEAGRTAVRADLRRQSLHVQFRRRGVRGRHQADPALSLRQRPSRALAPDHVQGCLPRADAGDHRLGREREVSRRLRPAGAGLRHHGADRRSGGRREGHRPGNRRHHGRADPGRRRHPRRVDGVPARPAERCATSMGCCWCSTRCSAAWAAPARCSCTSGPASRPT